MLKDKCKKGMFDEARIQLSLFGWVEKGKFLVIPNVSWSWFHWETDLVAITKAGYVHEYEIKISHADFKNDFKKPKHYSLKDAYNKQIHENRLRRMPNYFWYVAPIKAIPLCVPEYAGLVEVAYDRYGLRLFMIKKPSLLHHNKISDEGIKGLMRSLMFKYWKIARDRDYWKIQKDLFK
jgi:hypothetical protein